MGMPLLNCICMMLMSGVSDLVNSHEYCSVNLAKQTECLSYEVISGK